MSGQSNTRQQYRVQSGGLIDRSRTIGFTFDGVRYHGHPGDTLASALLANGVRLVGRSFKYHRPRGILAAGSEEPNALVELRTGARREANTRATVIELYEGLEAVSQNRWPSLRFDLMSINSLLSPVFVAGFYYKTFMWPAAFWEKLYEPMIRRAAGLGRAADLPDPDTYEKATAFCDVLVIGAGPTGLAAALAAARSGARVILADESAEFGGRGIDDVDPNDTQTHGWVSDAVKELMAAGDVRLMRRTTVFGVYDGGTYGALERVNDHVAVAPKGQPRQRLWRIVAKQSVLATGAIERPVVFGGNDRPGVMLAGAVRSYINRYGVVPGRRAVVFVNNDKAARAALSLHGAGAQVVALVDSRPVPSATVRAIAETTGAQLFAGGVVADALGKLQVRGAVIRTSSGATTQAECDLIAVSGGFNPNVQLTTHLGGRVVWDETLAAFVAGSLPQGMTVAGAAAGLSSFRDAVNAGTSAGTDAAIAAGFAVAPVKNNVARIAPEKVSPLWRVEGTRGKAFVDFQNDVTAKDVELAHREGFRSVEHLKRYTTLGMATDQGKTANVNALAIMSALTGKSIPETGVTLSRPPYTPVAIGAFAGHHRGKQFKATRYPPSYKWAKEQGAQFVEAGLWLRPAMFPKSGDKSWLDTVTREVNGVRNNVGICDVSTLGKIDIQGRDAAVFLERVYINAWKGLAVGRARYGAMLREDGMLMDDGTTARFAEDRFFMTTTTANAAKVLQHLEFCHQWHWPHLDVQMISATDQWAQYAVAGPKSRDLLREIVDAPFDISDEAFPYMAAAEITVCGGIKARIYRLSFSGERAYEIAVPCRYGDALIRRLMAVGEPLGVVAYGTEALGVMRIEKAHISGPELNGTTTAKDVGLGRMISAKKDCIGKVLAGRPGLMSDDRLTLIGFEPVDRKARLRGGAHLLPEGTYPSAAQDQGYMTSVAYSPSAGHWIGLGLLANGPNRVGEVLRAYDPVRSEDVLVKVVPVPSYDPEGVRLRG
jgi:sarcosine oxidase subunit alpha